MFQTVKKRVYFLIARYFRFWATIQLKRWGPKVIVITGSAGKTTLLHLVEAQLGESAHYSHHANSSFGIPFDILGLQAIQQSRAEWFGLFVLAPLALLKRPYKQSLYVVEVDADRPFEAQFLAQLLHPAVTLWVSALNSHTAGYDSMVRSGNFKTVREAVAHEYGNMAAATTDLVVLDGDNSFMREESKRVQADVKYVNIGDLKEYSLTKDMTKFSFGDLTYQIPALLPRDNFYQVAMADALVRHLGKQPDYSYVNFRMPPGRSNTFEGIRGTTLFDSTYNNSNIDSLRSVLQVFNDFPGEHKWAVVGDLLEQGDEEEAEHKKIPQAFLGVRLDRIILIGPRIAKHAAPLLAKGLDKNTKLVVFTEPKQVLEYLLENLKGGETVLFKGVRYLEGVIEPLLARRADAEQLVRRGKLWDKKRATWGLGK